jgi:twitching motility protein PilJ
MNTIRETIQDTSKRIKRLGESSQEIGNIVELIEEIAEQTNILALNASIEASRAGESSRGFAVVADEVQKLAERSATATRKIEVLVSTIQSDTNEAVVSMERSTTDVVGGALLAENAGAALEEIEQVSHQMAVLIQNISETGRDQNKLATAINKNMLVLRQIAAKTTQSTTQTSAAIRKLSELASQLRETVRGFRLPDNHGATGLLSPSRVAESLAREEAAAQAEAGQTTVPPVSATTEAALAAVAAQIKSAAAVSKGAPAGASKGGPAAAPKGAPAPAGAAASKGAPKGAQRTKVTG